MGNGRFFQLLHVVLWIHVIDAICIFNFSVILDAGDGCNTVNFLIGGDTTTTRQWDIKVTQYACGQYDEAGPPGCLQYFTSTQNTIQKYKPSRKKRILSIWWH